MKSVILKALSKQVKLPPEQIEVFIPSNPKFGDLSTNLAMKFSKKLKQPPIAIAEELKAKIKLPNYLEKITVVKPGYLNFFLKDKIYFENLKQILTQKENYGTGDLYQNKKVMIEFAHPNPFKIMHIGHLRNIILGESLVRLFEAQGAQVIRANYQGDVGLHVAKCVWAMSKFRPEKYPTDINERVDFLSRCYVEGAKMYEKGGAAKDEIIELNSKIYHQNDKRINKIWELGVKWSLDKFRQLYKRLDTVFDRQYLESETVKLGFYYVNLALKKGILSKSRGAVIFNGEKYGLDTRVFLNNQGFLTYEGKELGLVYLKLKEFGKLDLHVNNVAIEQKSFFRVVYKVEELLDPEHFKGVNYHNAYDFVGLKSGKMSSRKGQVVSAESVLNEANKRIKKIIEQAETKLTEEEIDKIAIAAVKYTFQKMSPFKYLAFDLDACVSFSGDSGPYLQYTYARAISILRKNIAVNEEENYQINQSERLLLQKLWQYKEIIKNAVLNYSPNYLAGYLNDLAQVFNNYYVHYKVRGNRFRTELTQATAQVIKNGLYLLGIKTLDRM